MRPASLVLLSAVLGCTPAHAQQPKAPFTLDDVKALYRVGLKLKVRRAFAFGGRKQVASHYLEEVTGTNPKGYKLRTTRLSATGEPGKVTEKEYPWAPLLVDPSGVDQTLEDVTVKVPAGTFEAKLYTQTFPSKTGGAPGKSQTWYATKHPGLKLKDLRVSGNGNRIESELVELTLRPERGERPTRLPWGDEAIRKQWTVGSRMAYDAKMGAQQLTFWAQITKADEAGFTQKDKVTDSAGKVLLDREKAHPWKNWLLVLKEDPGLKIGDPVDVTAAGKTYRCRPYTIERAGRTETSFLALEVPGLTVKFVSDGERTGHAERVLTEVSFGTN